MEGIGIIGSIIAAVFLCLCTTMFWLSYSLPYPQWHCTQYDTTADHCVVYTHRSLWDKPHE